MTEDDIIERVATAQREAPSFAFEWRDIVGEEAITEGQIRYDDDGEVDLLSYTTRDDEDAVLVEIRLVDGTAYERSGGAGEFQVLSAEERQVTLWDWAETLESQGAPDSVEELSESDVEGTTTTEYEVRFDDDNVQRWWIDDEDRLLRVMHMGSGRAGDGGFLRDWGDEFDVAVPDNVAGP